MRVCVCVCVCARVRAHVPVSVCVFESEIKTRALRGSHLLFPLTIYQGHPGHTQWIQSKGCSPSLPIVFNLMRWVHIVTPSRAICPSSCHGVASIYTHGATGRRAYHLDLLRFKGFFPF